MDPLTALIIAMWIAGRFTKNVYQDSVYKVRGEDPPSFRREQERRARRASGDGPGRRLLGNAWADACAAADERRARLAARATERRHAKWVDGDADAVEAEAREMNERVSAVPETVYVCGGCGTSLPLSDVAGYALSGDPLCRDCRTGQPAGSTPEPGPAPEPTRRNSRPAPYSVLVEGRCTINDSPVTCPDCGAATGLRFLARKDDQSATARCPRGHEWDEPRATGTFVADLYRTTQAAPDDDTTPVQTAADGPGGTVTHLNQWRRKGTPPPITKEDLVSGETTNLSAALQYTQEMADQCGAGAASCETSIATLQNADVSGDVIAQLTQAQEALNQAMAAFSAAHADLTGQLSVKDAYMANQGAGDKQFVTQD